MSRDTLIEALLACHTHPGVDTRQALQFVVSEDGAAARALAKEYAKHVQHPSSACTLYPALLPTLISAIQRSR